MSEALIGPPPTTAVDTMTQRKELAPPSTGWRNFFASVFRLLTAVTQSGTTAQRPAEFLFKGQPYFDTTIGKPIWYTAGGVWVDATGAPV